MRLVDTSAWIAWLTDSAVARGADLLTGDRHSEGLTSVRLLPKADG